MKLRASHIKDKKNGAIPFAKSYFFRRILAFEEATRKGSHAKKKKEKLEEKLWVLRAPNLHTCALEKRQHAHNSESGDTHARLTRHGRKRETDKDAW